MPLQIDRLIATSVETNTSIQNSTATLVDNTDVYPNSIVFSVFSKTANINSPFGKQNVYSLLSNVNMFETDTDSYFVILGSIFSQTEPQIVKTSGSFNQVNLGIFSRQSNSYSRGSFVNDANSPGDIWIIDLATTSLLQVDTNEYWVLALMYTEGLGENFLANVTLDIQISSSSEIRFSNEFTTPII